MAKTLQDAPLTTRNARNGLGSGMHWRALDPDIHLGYRKGKRGGRWVVRWRNGVGYQQGTLGTADDIVSEGCLSYDAAQRAARDHVTSARQQAKAEADGPVVTVRLAVERYVAKRDARASAHAGRPVRSDAGQRLGRYVLGEGSRGEAVCEAPLSQAALFSLSDADLSKWRDSLPEKMKQSTKQRLVNDLKAALNAAYDDNREKLPHELPGRIKHGLRSKKDEQQEVVKDSPARDNQILSDKAISKLLVAAKHVDNLQRREGDLYRLVLVLAATGARFSQVARLRVHDLQIDRARLLVPPSRKGKGIKSDSISVPVGPDVLAALSPAVEGRDPSDALLEHWRHIQIKGGRWVKDRRVPWGAASEFARDWDLVCKEAKMPNVIPYALRHSSIVRGIRANLPIRLVAAIHDTSVVMIERHYSRYITDGLEELAARAVVQLVMEEAAE